MDGIPIFTFSPFSWKISSSKSPTLILSFFFFYPHRRPDNICLVKDDGVDAFGESVFWVTSIKRQEDEGTCVLTGYKFLTMVPSWEYKKRKANGTVVTVSYQRFHHYLVWNAAETAESFSADRLIGKGFLLPLDKIDANSAHGVKFIFQLLDHCMPG